MAPWCLFDFTLKEIDSINIVLGHLPSEATGKRLGEKKAQFDCFNKS